jgi:hypothetical protein
MASRPRASLPEINAHFVGNEPLPSYLAGSLLLNFEFAAQGQLRDQIDRIEAIVARIKARTAGTWHVEGAILSAWHLDVVNDPANPYTSRSKFSREVCLTPHLSDPEDLVERETLAEVLGDALSDPEFFLSLPLLVDWAISPLVHKTHGPHGDFRNFQGPYQNRLPNTAGVATRLRALRAARRGALAPFLDGRWMVRDHDAFRRFHSELDEHQAMAIASLVRSNKLELGPRGAGFDHELRELAIAGWCRIDKVAINASYGTPARVVEMAIRVGYSRKLWPAELLAN